MGQMNEKSNNNQKFYYKDYQLQYFKYYEIKENDNIDICFCDYLKNLIVELKNNIKLKVNEKYNLHNLNQSYNDDIKNIYDIIQYYFDKNEKNYMFYIVKFKELLEQKLIEFGNIAIEFYNKTNPQSLINTTNNFNFNEYLFLCTNNASKQFNNIIDEIIIFCSKYNDCSQIILDKFKNYKNLLLNNDNIINFKIIYGFNNIILINMINNCNRLAFTDDEYYSMIREYYLINYIDNIYKIISSNWFNYQNTYELCKNQLDDFNIRIKTNKEFNANPYIKFNNNFIYSIFVIDFILSYYVNTIKPSSKVKIL